MNIFFYTRGNVQESPCSHDKCTFFDCVETISSESGHSQYQKLGCGMFGTGLWAFEILIKEFAFSGKRTGQITKEQQGNAVHRER